MAKKIKPSQKLEMENPTHVYWILFHALEEYTEDFLEAVSHAPDFDPNKEIQLGTLGDAFWEECSDKFNEKLSGLEAIFSGEATEFINYRNWDPAAVGRSLRKEFAFQLMALSDEDRELFDDDVEVVTFALSQFLNDGQKLIINGFAQDHDPELHGKEVHEFVVHWTELLTQKPFPGKAKE